MLLENLSENKIQTLIELNNYTDIVFGGSIALCAYDIINRPIKDIDIVVNNKNNRVFNIGTSNESHSFINAGLDRIENIDRTLLKSINDLNYRFEHYAGFTSEENICLFLIKSSIPYTNFAFEYSGIQHIIKLLHPDYIIAAKSQYSLQHNIKKHIIDCDTYRNWNNINNFQFQTLEFVQPTRRRAAAIRDNDIYAWLDTYDDWDI